MSTMRIERGKSEYPTDLTNRLGEGAPCELNALGDLAILNHRLLGLFCSIRCPGDIILKTFDEMNRFCDEGIAVISGFHSPIEKECLRILLRGDQPIVWCPARTIDNMRIPANMRPTLEAGRLLILSPFIDKPRRVTKDSAIRRNEFVAALSDEALIAHITPGGHTESLIKRLQQWKIPIRRLDFEKT